MTNASLAQSYLFKARSRLRILGVLLDVVAAAAEIIPALSPE